MVALYNLAPVPNGPLDSGGINTPLPGGGVSGDLGDLQKMMDWFGKGGFGFPNQGQPTPQGTTQTTETPAEQIQRQRNEASKKSIAGWLGLPSASQAAAVIVGLIFIAGGLFLLAKGPVVNVVTRGARNLAVGA